MSPGGWSVSSDVNLCRFSWGFPDNRRVRLILLHGNKVILLSLRLRLDRLSTSGQLFQFSGQSVERLYIYEEATGMGDWEKTHELWQGLPSLRELFVHGYPILIDQLTAPNLTHTWPRTRRDLAGVLRSN